MNKKPDKATVLTAVEEYLRMLESDQQVEEFIVSLVATAVVNDHICPICFPHDLSEALDYLFEYDLESHSFRIKDSANIKRQDVH